MSDVKQTTEDIYDLIKSLEKAKESGNDPRTGIDVLTDALKVFTNGIPNGKLKSFARQMLGEINAAGKLGIENIDRYQDRLREAAGDDGVPGFIPSTTPPPPPGMERQPTVIVSDNGRTFTQGPDRIVPIGSKLPNDRPYYIDGDGNRIYPPPGGWAEGGIPPNGTEPGEPSSAISPTLGTTPDPKVKVKVVRYVDPLILDLDGDGLEISPLSKGVLFDANGDTIKTGTAWAASDDGMLVWDRNGNGLIDSGAELFGDETVLTTGPNAGKKAANGFVALAELDSNADGKFDLSDAQYANLRIWRDMNQDGISQADELKTLADSGVKSISLTNTTVNTNYTDAILAQSGSFTRMDDSTGQAGSFILAQNNFVRSFAPITVSADAKALNNVGGSGWVRDLQEAATQSTELIGLYNQVKNATTRDGYKQAVGTLMQAWGNDSGYNSASKQAQVDGYGLILSDPLDDQERGWMDVAVKGSADSRNAFRATLSTADMTKFDAMRERMVGGAVSRGSGCGHTRRIPARAGRSMKTGCVSKECL